VEGRFIVDKIAMKKSRLMRMGRKEGGWLLGGKRRRWNMVVMDEVQMIIALRMHDLSCFSRRLF
jgi:hypothetical protein